MNKIDLNCDLGESYGAYTIGADDKVLRFITSANIACGYHAGDPSVMARTVKQAYEQGVSIGAHPGLPDLNGFGRRMMHISQQEAYDLTLYQLGALHAFCRVSKARLNHVKPHGALYNMAAKDEELAEAIASAVYHFDPSLILYGLSGSELIHAGNRIGLQTASEVFADRTYEEDGSLTPRSKPNAVIHDLKQAEEQVIQIIKHGTVTTSSGELIKIKADTICVHGDSPSALSFVKQLNSRLQNENIIVSKIGDY
jgi:5-oxoprolinase (ATP-hydrolysing) subunit A